MIGCIRLAVKIFGQLAVELNCYWERDTQVPLKHLCQITRAHWCSSGDGGLPGREGTDNPSVFPFISAVSEQLANDHGDLPVWQEGILFGSRYPVLFRERGGQTSRSCGHRSMTTPLITAGGCPYNVCVITACDNAWQ